MMKTLYWITTAGWLAILLWICSLFIESRTVLKWPQTKGQVISSMLLVKHSPDYIDFNSTPVNWYAADVQYQYLVDGGLYTSNRISIQEKPTRSSEAALKIVNKYRHDRRVNVYYDPANPQNSCLDPANIGDLYIPLLVETLLLFLSLIIFSQ